MSNESLDEMSEDLIPIFKLPNDHAGVEEILHKLRLDPIALTLSRGDLAKKAADVEAIVADVAARGDEAIVEVARRFDDPDFSADQIRVTQEEMHSAAARVP